MSYQGPMLVREPELQETGQSDGRHPSYRSNALLAAGIYYVDTDLVKDSGLTIVRSEDGRAQHLMVFPTEADRKIMSFIVRRALRSALQIHYPKHEACL